MILYLLFHLGSVIGLDQIHGLELCTLSAAQYTQPLTIPLVHVLELGRHNFVCRAATMCELLLHMHVVNFYSGSSVVDIDRETVVFMKPRLDWPFAK